MIPGGHIPNLLASYLSNRQQVVGSGEGSSKPSIIKSGIPQGSVLGTASFLIFINDLPLLLDKCSIDLFANGVTYHTHGKQ